MQEVSRVKQLIDGVRLALGRSSARRAAIACGGLLVCATAGAETFPPMVELSELEPANGGDGSAGFAVFPMDAGAPTVFAGVDVNGDGADDLALGFSGASLPGRTYAGRVYVLFGRNEGFAPVVELADIVTEGEGHSGDGFVLNGEQGFEGSSPRFYGDYAGGTLAGDDFNGDGIDDLLVGAEGARRDYVVFGHEAPFAAQMELAALAPENGGDGSAGAIISGVNGSLGTNGHGVHVAGDVNGDGIGDIAVGQPFFNEGGAGRLYVAFGSNPLPTSLTTVRWQATQTSEIPIRTALATPAMLTLTTMVR